MRDIDLIIIHHSGFPNSRNSSQFRAIDRYHRMIGWGGCGYHYVIEPDGVTYVGRPESGPGRHAGGYNARSIGVCVTGNFEIEHPTAVQVGRLGQVIDDLRCRYPGVSVKPHCDVNATLCPGKNLKTILSSM